MPKFDYTAIGRERIIELLRHQHAAVKHELFAKLSDQHYGRFPPRIDPHYLGPALDQLVDAHEVVPETATSTGGYDVTAYRLADRYRQKTRALKAAARHRKLHARYRSWAEGQLARYRDGLIGPALEYLTEISLSPAHERLHPIPGTSRGNVQELLGHHIPGGSLDLAGHALGYTPEGRGRAVHLVFEIKNRRDWIYPRHQTIYPLLYKAACLQGLEPNEPLLPVLITRRRSHSLFDMGKDLGFYVIEVHDQPIFTGGIRKRLHLEEVNHELGYRLVPANDPHNVPRLPQALAKIPPDAVPIAERRRNVGTDYRDYYDTLRDRSLSASPRTQHLHGLQQAARQIGLTGQWTWTE
jgi:hypothetical protein